MPKEYAVGQEVPSDYEYLKWVRRALDGGSAICVIDEEYENETGKLVPENWSGEKLWHLMKD